MISNLFSAYSIKCFLSLILSFCILALPALQSSQVYAEEPQLASQRVISTNLYFFVLRPVTERDLEVQNNEDDINYYVTNENALNLTGSKSVRYEAEKTVKSNVVGYKYSLCGLPMLVPTENPEVNMQKVFELFENLTKTNVRDLPCVDVVFKKDSAEPFLFNLRDFKSNYGDFSKKSSTSEITITTSPDGNFDPLQHNASEHTMNSIQDMSSLYTWGAALKAIGGGLGWGSFGAGCLIFLFVSNPAGWVMIALGTGIVVGIIMYSVGWRLQSSAKEIQEEQIKLLKLAKENNVEVDTSQGTTANNSTQNADKIARDFKGISGSKVDALGYSIEKETAVSLGIPDRSQIVQMIMLINQHLFNDNHTDTYNQDDLERLVMQLDESIAALGFRIDLRSK